MRRDTVLSLSLLLVQETGHSNAARHRPKFVHKKRVKYVGGWAGRALERLWGYHAAFLCGVGQAHWPASIDYSNWCQVIGDRERGTLAQPVNTDIIIVRLLCNMYLYLLMYLYLPNMVNKTCLYYSFFYPSGEVWPTRASIFSQFQSLMRWLFIIRLHFLGID